MKENTQNAEKITNVKNAESIIINGPNNISIGKTKKKKMSHKKKMQLIILVPLISIVLILVAIYFIFRFLYNAEYEQALNLLKSGKLSDAAAVFHSAASHSSNKEEFVEAKVLEGECYYLECYFSGNTDKVSFKKEQTKEIFNSIINNDGYADAEFYYDAVADMCYIYYIDGVSTTDPKWVRLINILSKYEQILLNEFKDNLSNDKISTSNITQISKAYFALYYYYHKLYFNSSEENRYSVLHKAMYYGKQFMDMDEFTKGLNNYTNVSLIDSFLNDYVSLILVSVPKTDNKTEIMDSAISQITEKIDELQKLKADIRIIFKYKYTLTRFYMFKCIFSTDQEELTQYGNKTETLMRALLTTTPADALSVRDLAFIATYMIDLHMTNNEDVEMIVNAFNSYITYCYDNSKDIYTITVDKLYFTHGCVRLLEEYGYSDALFDCGKKLYDAVVLYSEFIDASNEELLEYSEYYFSSNSEYYINHQNNKVSN